MLAIHCKRTDNVELTNPVLAHVRETYGDRDAEDAADDLAAIQAMRNEMVTAQSGSQVAQKDSLTKCGRGPCACMGAHDARGA